MRAEIDIPEITAEEASSLNSAVAQPEAFKAAGLEFNPALTNVRISLQRRADGRAFLRLTTDRPVSEPFVDLILEANWASGRIVRDYTMLFDPPNLRSAPVPAPTTAQVTPAQVTATPAAPATAAPRPSPQASVAPAPAVRPIPAPAPAPRARSDGESKVTVRAGDTAGAIAARTKSPEVSLDQMLVALLRNNESAFIGGNLNRLRAGAVLDIPSAEQAKSVSETQARETVVAQARDFNEFRGKLASNAPSMPVATPDRKSGGTVQAQVNDARSAAPTPDKLTLSKAPTAAATADKAAQDRASRETAQRTAELNKNIEELAKLSSAAGTAAPAGASTPPAASTPAPAPAAPPTPAVVVATPPAPAPAAPVVAASSPAPAPAAAASAAPARPKPVVAPPAPVEEESFLSGLLGNPTVLAAAAALVAILAALGVYKARQRRKSANVDSAFLESRLQPDSFFGASGGQRVDTNDGAATGSSMVYSPSQLDAVDDVDPVAEADVYLAYGRDIQAEEILKEALRTHPTRLAIHQKLLDIYARRRDTQAFAAMAGEAYKIAGEGTPEWTRICEQGLSIDPANPLYRPGGQPVADASLQTTKLDATAPMQVPAAGSAATTTNTEATMKMAVVPAAAAAVAAAPVDLDLDLDFSLDEEPSSSIVEAQPSTLGTESTVSLAPIPVPAPTLDMDFGANTTPLTTSPGAAPEKQPVELTLPDLDASHASIELPATESDEFRQQAEVSFGTTSPVPLQAAMSAGAADAVDAPLPDVSFNYTTPGPLTLSPAASQAAPAPASEGMLEFDLGTLSLELEPLDPAGSSGPEAPSEPEDPLATKLALAEEFVSIGDDDGARALIEEVIAEASGDLKAKAQRALSALS